ncbi:MAG: hypothetical protein LBF60_09660 [Treponema sp.]|jgi:hypothetical protein|nr:hypothetical protein [Treponema sp.]
MNTDKIIYQLSVEDLQTVADEELGRNLTEEEICLLEDKVGDFIDWYSAISCAIDFYIKEPEVIEDGNE